MFAIDTVHIDRSPDEVFLFISDVHNFGNWLHDTTVLEARVESAIVGSTWRQESWTSGVRLRFEGKVTACEAPHRFSYEAGTHVMYNWVEVVLSEHRGGTRVETAWRMEGSTWYLRWLFNRLAKDRFTCRMHDEARRNLAGLKHALETKDPASGRQRLKAASE